MIQVCIRRFDRHLLNILKGLLRQSRSWACKLFLMINEKTRWVRQKSGMFEDKPVVENFCNECKEKNNFCDDNIIDVTSPVRLRTGFTQLWLLQLDDLGLHIVAKNFITVLNQSPELKNSFSIRLGYLDLRLSVDQLLNCSFVKLGFSFIPFVSGFDKTTIQSLVSKTRIHLIYHRIDLPADSCTFGSRKKSCFHFKKKLLSALAISIFIKLSPKID